MQHHCGIHRRPTEAANPKMNRAAQPSTLVYRRRPKTLMRRIRHGQLRALVAVMPDAVFCCHARSWQQRSISIPQSCCRLILLFAAPVGRRKIATFDHHRDGPPKFSRIQCALDGQMVPIPLVEIIPNFQDCVY